MLEDDTDLDDAIDTIALKSQAEREAADARSRNMTTISTLYGLTETDDGVALLIEVVEIQGFSALSDHAIAALARKNLSMNLSRR